MVLEVRSIIEVAYLKNKTRDLGKVLIDLSEWASGLTKEDETELNSILNDVNSMNKNEIDEILRNRIPISSYDDYLIIENYVNENWELLNEKGELDGLNRLLSAFNGIA